MATVHIVMNEGREVEFPARELAEIFAIARGIEVSSIITRDEGLSIDLVKKTLHAQIDGIANAIYSQFVPTPGLLHEYQQAEIDARYWSEDKNRPVPASVVSWAEAQQWTNEQACSDILTAALKLRGLTAAVRRHRLMGKAKVMRALTAEEAQKEAAAAITTLKIIAASGA